MNYIVGAGILGLPFAFRQAGLGIGLFLLLLVGAGTIYSFLLLLWSAKLGQAFTFETLALRAWGAKASLAVKIIIIIDSFGPLSAYMIIIGDVARDFALSLTDNEETIMTNRAFLSFLCVVLLILPLSLLKSMRYLEFTSFLSLIPLIYLLVLQVIYFAQDGVGGTVSWVGSGSGFFQSLPIFIFAYSSQQALFPIYNELKNPLRPDDHAHREKTSLHIIHWSVALSALAYAFSGLFGYLQFPETAEGNILRNYPEAPEITALLLSTAVSIILSYPVIVFPCRHSVDRLLFPTRQPSYLRFVCITVGILLTGYIIAVAIPQLATVIGLFGGITSTTIAYILPPWFYIRIAPLNFSADRKKWIAMTVFIVGSICGFVSAAIILKEFFES